MKASGRGVKNLAMRSRVQEMLRSKERYNFTEIGEALGVSRERVRQIAAEFGITGRVKGHFRGVRRYNGQKRDESRPKCPKCEVRLHLRRGKRSALLCPDCGRSWYQQSDNAVRWGGRNKVIEWSGLEAK